MTDTTTQALELELPELPKQHEELRARWKCESCDGSGYMGEMPGNYFQPPEPCKCIDCDGNGYVPVEAFTAEQVREARIAAIEADRNKRAISPAADAARATDMLTPLCEMPGYADPIIFGEYSVRDYHVAVSGEGPKACEWQDKPHRLLYDLCRAILSLASQPKDMSTASTHAADMPTKAGNVNMSDKEIRQDYNSTGDILAEITGCYDQDVMLWELADRVRKMIATIDAAIKGAATTGQAQSNEVHYVPSKEPSGSRDLQAEVGWSSDVAKD